MIQQVLRKSPEGYIITIPDDEVERGGLQEGQLIGVSITTMEQAFPMRPEVQKAFDAIWERNAELYRELAALEDDSRGS